MIRITYSIVEDPPDHDPADGLLYEHRGPTGTPLKPQRASSIKDIISLVEERLKLMPMVIEHAEKVAALQQSAPKESDTKRKK